MKQSTQLASGFIDWCSANNRKYQSATYSDLVTYAGHQWTEEDMREAYYLITGKVVE